MSTAATQVHDVFLCHGAHDTGLTAIVEQALAAAGLSVFSLQEEGPTSDILEEMRHGVGDTSAVVILLTRSVLRSENLPFQAGAAMAWKKPVYVVYDGISRDEIPAFLRNFHLLPLSELPDVVRQIAASQQPLSRADREVLARLYAEVGVPADRLLTRPSTLRNLAARFCEETQADVSPDRLLQELVRLHKQGRLPTVEHRR